MVEDLTVVNTPPTVKAIERSNPITENTDSQTLVYAVFFSKDVVGVDKADFALSPDSTGGTGNGTSPVASVSGSGAIYHVTVSATLDGTYNLDLVSSGHGIVDIPNNPLTNTTPTGADQSYTVNTGNTDSTAPTVSSIERHNPSSATTSSQTLVYKVTFSEDVTGVDKADFALSPDSTGGTGNGSPVASVSGSGAIYHVTVSATLDGTYNLDLVSSGHGIADTESNPLTNTIPTGADQTYTVNTDSTAPTVSSIERHNPSSATTSSQTLVYKVTFSEDVTGVDKADFALSPDSTGGTGNGSPVASVSGSGAIYHVTVSATLDGTYNLDLVSSGHGIADIPDNPLTNTTPTGADQSYTVNTDSTAPTVSSIERHNPSSATTSSQTLVYKVTFSEDVTGVDKADFALSPDSTGGTGNGSPVASVSGSGAIYHVTVSATLDGTYNLDLVSSGHGIADIPDNPLTNTTPTGADQSYTVNTVNTDSTAPTVSSIERHNPSSATTSSQTLVYKVTFSEDVTGVDKADFALSPDSTGGTGNGSPVASVSGSGAIYHVTVSATLDGTYNLDLVSSGHGIADIPDNPLTNTTPTGADQSYTVNTVNTDSTAPTVSSIERHNPSSATTSSQTLVYKVTFSEDVTGVDKADFALSPDSTGGTGNGSPVASVSGSGAIYHVTVSATLDGTYNLDLVSSGHGIADIPDNPLTNTTPTGADQSYTVNTAPTVSSIERHNPSSATTSSQTLVYKVTFSEDVTGVDKADFALSPDSTGGSTTTISNSTTITTTTTTSGQFTQTRSPSLAIPDLQAVSDTITVPDSGTATSVSVAVDIEHRYIGDLLVSLIAPDGTAQTLHNRTGGTADNINQTYTPSFGSVQIAGNWILQISDHYDADPGILNSWTLTVNYAAPVITAAATTAIVTVSPVTDITGSGGVYNVAVSASQDGTYNLDLVSSGHGIADTESNPLTDTIPTGADQTYTVSTAPTDNTAPTLASIQRYVPAAENTGSQTLVYRVTFSEDVTGVDKADFALSTGSTGGGNNGASPVTSISGSGSVYYVIVSAAQDGTYNLDLVSSGHGIADTESNPLTDTIPTGADQTYTVSTAPTDNTVPTLASIQRYIPAAENTGSQTLVYRVTFSENVTGVHAVDFVLSPSSTGGAGNGASPVTSISGSGSVYYVIVSAAQDGTYNLDLVSSGHGIADTESNPLTDTIPTGADQTYTVSTAPTDNTVPTLASIQRYVPAAENTGSQTLVYRVTFSEDVTGVHAVDFVLSPSSTGGAGNGASPVTSISGSGSVYYVIVSAAQDGTYNLDLVSSGHGIADTESNPLTDTVPTTEMDQTYNVSTAVDNTAPTISSIERYSPAAENTDSQSLVYRVTFNEDVMGVNAADFVLSPDSTGGNTTTTTTTTTATHSGQFTQTRSPSLAIPDLQTVSDTITVHDSGTATSVSVAVDIEHNYIGDLLVNLIAPDGTVQTLHSRTGGNTANITQTYTPSFGSVQIEGEWVLQINDDHGTDPGILNSWTLTVNYIAATVTTTTTTTTATVDPATSISGSGSVYYVTVPASKDGTYNLDLVSSGHGIADIADNPLTDTVPTTGTDQTYTFSTVVIDSTAPTISSIEWYNPAAENTGRQTLIYKVTFSEVVTGVDKADFALSPDSTGGTGNGSPVASVSGSGAIYHVTVSATLDGTYNLDLVSPGHGIADTADNPLTDTVPTTGTDQTYTVNIAPTVSSIEWYNPAAENTGRQTLIYKVTFSEVVTGVGKADFALSPDSTGGTGNSTSSVTGVTGSGSVYYATVSATQDGTYNLDLVSSGHGIADTADNPLTDTVPTTGTDQTYTVNIAPTILSIERHSLSNATTSKQTLVYVVTFSENVTGVDKGDFVLSPGSTGGIGVGYDPVAGVTGSGSVYDVIVVAIPEGTYNIDLVSSGHGIINTTGKLLTDTVPTTGADQTYTYSVADS